MTTNHLNPVVFSLDPVVFQAGEATKAIKLQIIDVLKLQEETTMEMGPATPS